MSVAGFARVAGLIASFAIVAAVSAVGVSGAEDLLIGTNPAWSPDGTQVAFAYSGTSTFRIVTAPVSGGGPIHTVYSGKSGDGCCDPMLWSRAGRILFDSNFTLMSESPHGGKPTTLAKNISRFILSPNGETAAFDGPGGDSPSSIGLVNVSGGKPVTVPRPANAGDAVDAFAPDGTDLVFNRIPFVNGEFGGPWALMVEHVGGGTPVPLSQSALIGASRVPAGSVYPEWSPDGRWIAYMHLGKLGGYELEVVSTTGAAAPHTVAGWDDGAFSWSPNSKLLACFCGLSREHIRLTTLNPQGTKRTILWANRSLRYITEDTADRPQWSPDGSKLAFLARVGPGYPPIQVWVVGADGTGLRRIA
jgi:Tol biopolymer transport system component